MARGDTDNAVGRVPLGLAYPSWLTIGGTWLGPGSNNPLAQP